MSMLEDIEVRPSPSDPFEEEQTVLILVGLVAAGKSTFAEALENHVPSFRRCNQDELGSRQRVEEVVHRTLCEGRSPCVDRTNFNVIQRSYWSAIAHAFPGTSVSMIVFDTPYHVCASRLKRRKFLNNYFLPLTFTPPVDIQGTSHPTIKDAQQGVAILRKFASDFQMPSPDEGYDHLIRLRPADHPHPEYTRSDILSILERLKASTRDAGTSVAQHSNETLFGHSVGNHSRTDRARGYYRGFSLARGSLNRSPRFTSRVGGSISSNSNWERPSSDVATNQGRSAAVAIVPPMERSKGMDSAEGCHNRS